jgi:putative oxidoreductase
MAMLNSGAINAWESLTARLRGIADVLPPLVLRLIIAWEFWASGLQKYTANFDWATARYIELGGAVLLVFGLFTRCAAYGLLMLTFVAIAAAHRSDTLSIWSNVANSFGASGPEHDSLRTPLFVVVMLLPIIFQGAGKVSLDFVLTRVFNADATPEPVADAYAWSLALLALGVALSILTPILGLALVIGAVLLFLFGRYARA